jgi:hypothetical protein
MTFSSLVITHSERDIPKDPYLLVFLLSEIACSEMELTNGAFINLLAASTFWRVPALKIWR